MLGESHDVLHEFPNLGELITQLHEKDPELSRLMDSHDQLDKEIRNLETLAQPISDFRMEELKKKRALLKDKIYQALKAHQASLA